MIHRNCYICMMKRLHRGVNGTEVWRCGMVKTWRHKAAATMTPDGPPDQHWPLTTPVAPSLHCFFNAAGQLAISVIVLPDCPLSLGMMKRWPSAVTSNKFAVNNPKYGFA